MADINLLVIMLNVNSFSVPIKRQRISNWILKKNPNPNSMLVMKEHSPKKPKSWRGTTPNEKWKIKAENEWGKHLPQEIRNKNNKNSKQNRKNK